jgi:hypothetical protein
MRHGSALGLLVTLLAGCGSASHPYSLDVGGDDSGTLTLAAGGDASRSLDPLDAYIEQGPIHVTFVTLGCSGPCADVQAVATGGNPPYSFAWSDGSTSATRHVCPATTTTYSVKVTDTATSGEFARAAESVKVGLAANVLACPDGGAADSGASGACPPDASTIAPETVTPDYLDNAVAYFADGGALPPGHYSVSYVSGCVKYNGYSNFTVNGQSTFEYQIVGDSPANPIAVAPGTVALGIPFGYVDLASCEAANLALPPVSFDFDGGKLGIFNNDFQPPDNVIDPDGGAPTWRLSGGCR